MRKKNETLRETLLECAKVLAEQEGIEALNIRLLAKQAGVAVGTVYKYFTNKDEILLALTEEYWKKTLDEMRREVHAESFLVQLKETFSFLNRCVKESGAILMSSLQRVEDTGRGRMQEMQLVLRKAILNRMEQDKEISEKLWSENFTREGYADFILINIMALLQIEGAEIDFFIEIVRRTLY